jgi:hypothetical protein
MTDKSVITKFRNERSINGHTLDVLKSGLQKYMRRSDEQGSLYCAYQLDSFHLAGKDGDRIRTNFIHRLMIIFLEDIGIGGYRHWLEIDKQINILFVEGKKQQQLRNRETEIASIRKILSLCLISKKARIGSHLRTYGDHHRKQLQTTTNAYKQFTELLEQRHRDVVTYALMIDELKGTAFIFDELERVIAPEHKASISIARKWHKEIKTKEQFLTYMIPIAVHIYGCDDITQVQSIPVPSNWSDIQDQYATATADSKFVFDDYVYDKHTRSARNKTTSYFASVGAYVYPESELIDKELKALYEKFRGVEQLSPTESALPQGPPAVDQLRPTIPKLKIKLRTSESIASTLKPTFASTSTSTSTSTFEIESEYCQFVSRIQLTTSATRCDTYYGMKDDQLIFVKGPYLTEQPIANYLEVQEFKAKHNISYIDGQLVYLIPDRWPEGVPLGLRNSLDRTKGWPFLITKSIIPLSEIVFRTHSSKLWPPTQVIDPVATPLHISVFTLTRKQLYDYFCQLAVRLHFKISDLADRNFLVRGDCVYSIDEEQRSNKISLLTELKQTKYEYLKMMYVNTKQMMMLTKFDENLRSLLDAEFSN